MSEVTLSDAADEFLEIETELFNLTIARIDNRIYFENSDFDLPEVVIHETRAKAMVEFKTWEMMQGFSNAIAQMHEMADYVGSRGDYWKQTGDTTI